MTVCYISTSQLLYAILLITPFCFAANLSLSPNYSFTAPGLTIQNFLREYRVLDRLYKFQDVHRLRAKEDLVSSVKQRMTE